MPGRKGAKRMTYNPHHDYADASQWRGTTILTVRKNGKVVVVGDGQVSAGNTVMKSSARKVRTLAGGSVLTGFAGATADAFALLERLETAMSCSPMRPKQALGLRPLVRAGITPYRPLWRWMNMRKTQRFSRAKPWASRIGYVSSPIII